MKARWLARSPRTPSSTAGDFRDFYFKGRERKRQVVEHVDALRDDLGQE